MKAQGIRTPALYIPRAGRQRPCVASGSFDQILALRFSRMTTVPPDLIAKPVGAPVGRDRHRVLPGGATPAETSHALERRYRRGKPSSTQSNRPGASCSNPEKRTPQRPRTIPPESKTPDACLLSISGSGELSTYRRVTRSDDHAWALYRWNLDLVAGFGPLASDTEVALRNTIHDQLSTHFGRPDWWASPALILDDTTTDVLTRRERPSTQGNCSGGSTTLRARLGLMGG